MHKNKQKAVLTTKANTVDPIAKSKHTQIILLLVG